MLSLLLLNPKISLSPTQNPKNTFPHKISNSFSTLQKILKKYKFTLPSPPLKPSFSLFIPPFVKNIFPNPPIKPPNSTFIPPIEPPPSNLLVTCW